MNEPKLNYVSCPDAHGGHRMAYWQWGDAAASHVIVCVHGLTRQGRDFDVLARTLCDKSPSPLRVVCPDVAGRGQSDWLKDPTAYQIPTYAGDMLALLAQLHAQQPITKLDWFGTSMGGLIGMAITGTPGLPLPVPVRKMVFNDVGPALSVEGVLRIATYVGKTNQFASVQQAADAMWAISSSFGPHTPQEWLALSTPMVKPSGAGFTLHYDPAIGVPFQGLTPESITQGEVALWQLYDAIRADVLVLRGAQSDLLSPQTAKAMTERGPKARILEFAGVGHAPTLIAPNQTMAVQEFLFAP